MDNKIQVTVKTISEDIPLQLSKEDTILVLKNLLLELKGFDVDKQRLIFRGNILQNPKTLSSYGIDEGSILHLSLQRTSPGITPTNNTNVPNNSNPMNNEWMNQMLDNPFMQQILSNPDLMRSIISNNPWSRQLMENNPELRHVLESPDTIQFMSDMMRNPALRDEVIRNSDRAMANLESLPGGFNALHRLHNQLGDPYEMFYQQNQQQSNTSQTNNQQPEYRQTAPSNTPLPNPWAQNVNNNQNPNFNFMINLNQSPNLFNPFLFSQQQFPQQQFPQQQFPQQPFPFFNPLQFMQPFNFDMNSSTPTQTTNTPTPSNTPTTNTSTPSNITNTSNTNTIPPSPFTNFTELPPEQKYEVQLKQLESMGFSNKEVNIKALTESKGNVDRAISILIGDL